MYKLCHFVLADSKVLVRFPLLGLRIKLGHRLSRFKGEACTIGEYKEWLQLFKLRIREDRENELFFVLVFFCNH